jgi:hypothetical protein
MASALCFVAPVASAADPAPADSKNPLSKGFLALDINRDGYIDYKEATANPALDKNFDAVDTDKDGRLTPDEYNKGFALK